MTWVSIFFCEDVRNVGGAWSVMDQDFIVFDGFLYCVFVDLQMTEVFGAFFVTREHRPCYC